MVCVEIRLLATQGASRSPERHVNVFPSGQVDSFTTSKMANAQTDDYASLERQMVRGSIWTIGLRWSLRLAGLVNVIILARILTPDDFGIVAIATMIVGIVEVFAQTGQSAALIRHPNPSREHYDSAWTVSLLLGLALGVIVFALSPLTTAYFHEPRARLIVQILAVRTVLAGAQNIGTANFRRNLQFDKQYWFSVTPSLFAFGITVPTAFLLRNYWALVVGLLAEQIAEFALSYAMEPFRPRLSISKINEIWSFSIWTLIKNIGTFLNSLVDRIAIGGFAGSAAMGRYYVATDVAISPSQELAAPMVASLFPVMALVQNDREKRRRLYVTVVFWSALICTSTAVGVALVADDMVDLVLGSQWHDVKPLIPWLALSYGVLGLSGSVYPALEAIGRPLDSARLQWVRVVTLSLAIFPVAYYFRNLEVVAATRLAVTVLITPTLFLALTKTFDLRPRELIAILWRPLAASLIMATSVEATNAMIAFSGNLRLILDIVVGVSSYSGALLTLWILSGRPEGPDQELFLRGGFLVMHVRRRLERGPMGATENAKRAT